MPRREPMEKYADRRAKEAKARAVEKRIGPPPLKGATGKPPVDRPQAWIDKGRR